MKLIIVGGKGNGTVVLATVLDMIEQYNRDINFIGFVNNQFDSVKEIDSYPVLGDFNDLQSICEKHDALFINAITSVNTISLLDEKYAAVFPSYKDRMASLIHPSSFISYGVTIGEGVYIGPQNYIGQNAILEDMVFIHAQCYVARDSVMKEFSYLAPQAYIGAEAVVERGVYIGINASIRERVTLEEHCKIGMGAVVVKSTEKEGVYYGTSASKKN